MVLVVGLGNPGLKYRCNRHNFGFRVVDHLRDAQGWPEFRAKFAGVWTRGELGGTSVVLLKPETFMNLSGESVQPAVSFLKITPASVIVVHDELDIPFGDVRVKEGGGHAGHNGLRSIVQYLGTADFTRIRVGIGRPPAGFRGTVADYVLGDFSTEEEAEGGDIVARAADVVAKKVSELA